jgi:hypothetical protein
VLPLDVHAAVRELLGHLREWGERAGRRFDLSGPIARAEEVEHLAEQFTKRLATAEGKETRRLNEVLVRTERCLVRQKYAAADPYGQDLAVAQPPVPLLAPVNRLLDTERRSDEEAELLTLLVRRRNRLIHELAETARELRRGLED